MKTIITETEKRITLADIQKIENQYNFKMPESLKNLYLKYNGGILDVGENTYDLVSIKYGDLLMEETIDSLQEVEQHIPKEYLPFANTPVGHLICIYMESGNKNGQIFLFRHDQFEPIFYNNSLEEFLEINSIDEL